MKMSAYADCKNSFTMKERTMGNTKEKEWLNKYHQKVFETIAPYLTEEEAGWLREETQEF